MLDRLLEFPVVYTLTQRLWYRPRRQENYVKSWIKPKPGDRILDIGCGPGSLLALMPDVRYVGYDPNRRYIDSAKRRFGDRGAFFCGYLESIPDEDAGRFDIVLANGVLHHLSDPEAERVLSLAARALKPAGRMITRDGCYEENQSRLARLLLDLDRGRFVRTQRGYAALFAPHFDSLKAEIIRDALRLPYSLIHFELIRRKSA